MTTQTEYFVCGGGYPKSDNTHEFGLVRNRSPYVASTEELAGQLFRLCQHHSHLYCVNIDTGEMTLVKTGYYGVQAPNHFTLGHDLLSQIRDVIRANKCWMIAA